MADQHDDQHDDRGATAPSGDPPKGHEHMQGEGMTNGIPDAAAQDRATALPHTEREEAETAAGGQGKEEGGAGG